MARRLKMLSRVLILGRVAAADMAAGQAEPELNPTLADLQAILAAPSARRHLSDLIEMRATFRHVLAHPNSADLYTLTQDIPSWQKS